MGLGIEGEWVKLDAEGRSCLEDANFGDAGVFEDHVDGIIGA
jgi:hypothetical protein